MCKYEIKFKNNFILVKDRRPHYPFFDTKEEAEQELDKLLKLWPNSDPDDYCVVLRRYVIESKDEYGRWSSEGIGNNNIWQTEEEAEQGIKDLLEIWPESKYDDFRVVLS